MWWPTSKELSVKVRADYVGYDCAHGRLRCVFFLGNVGTSWDSVDDAHARLGRCDVSGGPSEIDQSTQEVIS